MFTGIIESTGNVLEVIKKGSNKSFWIQSPISHQLAIDQSLSHNGVCLTVEEVTNDRHRITAIDETLKKTTMELWDAGFQVNLERCLKLDSRLDGHIVQGHVDTTGKCISRKEKKGSWEYQFQFPKKFAELVIEKGSICIDGISLTAFDVKAKSFKVAIIPYTFQHTTIHQVKEGDLVNLEFDALGKYILRRLSLKE